jgi:hypothetical protein
MTISRKEIKFLNGLGTMTMGWTSTKHDSFAMMDSALENGSGS